jgi:hypothetical protein
VALEVAFGGHQKATSVLAPKNRLLKVQVQAGPRAAHLVSSSEGAKAAAPVSEAAIKEASERAQVLAEEHKKLTRSIPSGSTALGAAATRTESAKVVKTAASAGRSIDCIAIHILQHGATMPESKMADLLMDWRNNPDTVSGVLRETAQATLGRDHHIVTMLAPRKDTQLATMLDVQMLSGSEDQGNASLCGKKDIIITKFDDLLKKLMGQENAINAELAAVCLHPSLLPLPQTVTL